jgi:hypothetical protein
MYGVAKHKAVSLALILDDLTQNAATNPAQRDRFAAAARHVQQTIAILNDIPLAE